MARYKITATQVLHEEIEFMVLAKSKKAAKAMVKEMGNDFTDVQVTSLGQSVIATRVDDITDIDLPQQQGSLIDEEDL